MEKYAHGFCAQVNGEVPNAETSAAAAQHDCHLSRAGIWLLNPHEASSWRTAEIACQQRCDRCAQCQYVSFSLERVVCAWYSECNITSLSPSGSFRSVRANQNYAQALEWLPQMANEGVSGVNTLKLPCEVTFISDSWNDAVARGDALPTLKPCWIPARGATFNVEGFDQQRDALAPDAVWVLRGEAPNKVRGGHCAQCLMPYQVRSFAYLAFCFRASIFFARGRRHVRCLRTSRNNLSVDDVAHEPWHVFAASTFPVWQHQIMWAGTQLGMALPLFAAGHTAVTVLHNGLLSNGSNVVLRPIPWRAVELETKMVSPVSYDNVVFPIPLPYALRTASGPITTLADSNPRFAYALYGSSASFPAPAHKPRIAFLSRGISTRRRLVDEPEVVAELRRALPNFEIVVVKCSLAAKEFTRFAGAIGVHSGAFGNVHAMRKGSTVIEILHDRWGPRCFTNIALGVNVDYFMYTATLKFPDTEHHNSKNQEVSLNVSHFVKFAQGAFWQTMPEVMSNSWLQRFKDSLRGRRDGDHICEGLPDGTG